MSRAETQYREHPAINWSLLKELQKSPAHLAYRRSVPREDTPAMRLGRAVHSLILEPQSHKENFIVRPKFNGTGAVAARKEWEAANADKCALSEDEAETARSMADAVLKHESARELLEACDLKEQELYGNIYVDGYSEALTECKCRIDAYSSSLSALVDVKTTTDAGPISAGKTVAGYWYHAQLAFYRELLIHNRHKVHSCLIIFVEKEPPHGVAVYSLADSAISAGFAEVQRLLDTYNTCSKHCSWNGYSSEIESLDIPRWGYSQEQWEEKTALESSIF